MEKSSPAHPFRLRQLAGAAANPFRDGWVETAIERLTGLDHLGQLYQSLQPTGSPDEFLWEVIRLFGLDYTLTEQDAGHIPRSGGAVVVANHPFGGAEGVVLLAALRRLRPDVKVMANYMLQRIPELSDLFIAVDPFGAPGAAKANTRPLREAVRWVRNGGLLLIFPAGAVSHYDPLRGRIEDPAWSPTVARLIRLAQAPVVPLFVHGRNGLLFQLAGLLHPGLRTAMLAREFINKARQTLRFSVGLPQPYKRLDAFADDQGLMQHLRFLTYAMEQKKSGRAGAAAVAPRWEQAVADPVAPEVLANEIAALPGDQCVERSGRLAVFYARAEQIPWALQEIGRLRECTFRAVGEGTGKTRDIDLYDAYYLHLFVWNEEAREIVGAYRIGQADEILARFGAGGLYTRSLFKFGRRFVDALNPALELGRSFVRAEYQRSYLPLLLLWKGIGGFIVRHPRYRMLFGPVSISSEYETVSQQLLVRFLRENNYLPELARMVQPRQPFRAARRSRAEDIATPDLDGLSELIAAIENDQKGVPILLRQYLKLGGRVVGFNVDPEFNNALDGLIVVDLAQTDPKTLVRYLGEDGCAHYLAHHGRSGELARAS